MVYLTPYRHHGSYQPPSKNNWLTEGKVGIRQLTFPDQFPISIDDAANAARVNTTCSCDIEYVEPYLAAATASCEEAIGLSGIIKEFEASYDSFPPNYHGVGLEIPKAPVVSVDRIQYLDSSYQLQTLGTDIWQAQIASDIRAWIELKPHKQWPEFALDRTAAIFIRFKAGYGNTPDDLAGMPRAEQLRHAIRLLVTHWLNIGRDPVQAPLEETPYTVQWLLRTADPGFYAA